MSETKTKGLWRTGPDQANCGGGFNILADIAGETDVRIAHTSRVVYGGVELVSEAQAQAFAELIVRAVNAHDGLVARVIARVEACRCTMPRPAVWRELAEWLAKPWMAEHLCANCRADLAALLKGGSE